MKITKIVYAVLDGSATMSGYFDSGQIRCFLYSHGKWIEDSCPDIATKAGVLSKSDFDKLFPGIGEPEWPS
jgi:hypothetical protein